TQPNVLITGAAHGIGHATAMALARRGTPIGLIDRDATALAELAQSLQGQGAIVTHVAVDVTDRHALIRAVTEIAATLGGIDVLVACAGIGTLTQVPQLETTTLRQTLDVNLVGFAQSIGAFLPAMILKGRGHIVGLPASPAIAA